MTVSGAIQIYEENPCVMYAEPDYILSIPKNETESGSISADSIQGIIPNDPHFGNLWGLYNTGQSGGTCRY